MTHDPSESRHLAELMRTADHAAALAWLHSRYDRALEQLLRNEKVPAVDRGDLLQMVWLAAQEALPRYRGDCSPATWLQAIARHKVADWRRLRTRVFDDLTTGVEAGGPLAELLGLRAPRTPSSLARQNQRTRQIRAAIEALQPQELELVRLRFADGLTPAQIAQRLGEGGVRRPDGRTFTAADVSQRLHRALQKLREALREELAEPG